MNPLLLYALLLKATLTTFSGLGSLPIVRQDLVIERKVISDRQLAAAVAAGQSMPGPLGLYIVSVGYFAAGVPGACAGCLALMTPAFVIIGLLRYVAARAGAPQVQAAVQGVTLAAAGLILSAVVPLARSAIAGPVPAVIALAAFGILLWGRVDTLWVVAGSALAGLLSRHVR